MTKVPRYAQVIIDIAHADVDRVFTYAIPDGMALQVGMRVAVPFGRQEKEGYVLGFSDDCELPPDRIRQVKEPLEDYPAILPGLVELARGMSVSAHCPLAETLRLMIPAQMRGGRIGIKTEKAARLLLSGEALLAARAARIAGVVRVPSLSTDAILSVLDCGADHRLTSAEDWEDEEAR